MEEPSQGFDQVVEHEITLAKLFIALEPVFDVAVCDSLLSYVV